MVASKLDSMKNHLPELWHIDTNGSYGLLGKTAILQSQRSNRGPAQLEQLLEGSIDVAIAELQIQFAQIAEQNTGRCGHINVVLLQPQLQRTQIDKVGTDGRDDRVNVLGSYCDSTCDQGYVRPQTSDRKIQKLTQVDHFLGIIPKGKHRDNLHAYLFELEN